MRFTLSALALTLALSACNQPSDSAPDAAAPTPAPATPALADDGPETEPDPAIAAGEIPARFHGVWDAVTGTCDAASDMRVAITKRRIEYYESVGDVSGMGSDGDAAIADLVMTGEGQTWVLPTRLWIETTPDGERLHLGDATKPRTRDDLPRKRCPA